MKKLYEGNDVKVTYSDNNSDVTFVTFSCWEIQKHPVNASEYTDFGGSIISQLGFNVFSVQSNKNNWFQTNEVLEAAVLIKQHCNKRQRIITYGSSMGGYAAINFYDTVGASFFVAISPQVTLNPKFLPHSENRWKFEYSKVPFDYDYIVRGKCSQAKGLIIYDDLHLDKYHAIAAGQLTKGCLIPVSHSGHPSGAMLNRLYGLKNLIKDVANNVVTPDVVKQTISSRLGNTIEYLYSNVSLSSSRSKLVSRVEENKLSVQEYIWLMLTVAKSKTIDLDLSRLLIKNSFFLDVNIARYDKFVASRANLLIAMGCFYDALLELQKLKKSRPWLTKRVLFNMRDVETITLVISRFNIEVNILRDTAIALEEIDLALSVLWMKKARQLRPNGPYIKKKLEFYLTKI